MKRIPELDGLRGFACLLVVLYHYLPDQYTGPAGTVWSYAVKLFALGPEGVDLFFVLSGFLLGGVLMDNRDAPNYYAAFYARRSFRIFPLYFAWLALFPVACLAGHVPNADEAMPLWSYVLYVQNFFMAARNSYGDHWLAVTWSLAVEEQFYVVLPIIIRWADPKRVPGLLGLLILSAMLSRMIILAYFRENTLAANVLLFCRWDSLFIGVLTAWAVRKPLLRRHLWAVWLSLPMLAAGLAVILHRGNQAHVYYGAMQTWTAVMFAGLLLAALYAPPIRWVFRQRPLTALGAISYGVYLFHQGVSSIVHGWLRNASPAVYDMDSLGITGLSFGCTLALAAASYVLFERPLVQIGRRWSYAANN